MKNRRVLPFLAAIIIVVMITVIVLTVLKLNYKSSNSLNDYSIHAENIVADGKTVNVQYLLEDLCNEKHFKEGYIEKANNVGIEFDDINVHPNIYYLKYVADDEFRSGLIQANTNGLSDAMFSDYVDIYLPVFAQIDGDEHIIATIRIYFDNKDKTYHAIESEINPDYIENEHFLENTEHLIEENLITNCIWVYDSSFEGYTHSSVFLVKLDEDYKIYDYENIFKKKDFTPTLYDVEHYVKEKNLYEAENKPQYPNILNSFIIVLSVLGMVALIVAINKKRKY